MKTLETSKNNRTYDVTEIKVNTDKLTVEKCVNLILTKLTY